MIAVCQKSMINKPNMTQSYIYLYFFCNTFFLYYQVKCFNISTYKYINFKNDIKKTININ